MMATLDRGANILIVEDNRHMRRMLGELIRLAFELSPVFEAADGVSARLMWADTKPDLVIMDIGLPDASGIELTAEIKQALPAARIVVVTSHRDRAFEDAARRAGADAYVLKDDVHDRLLPVLEELVAQHD